MTTLAKQAEAAGLQIEWEDADGNQHTVADDTIRAILDTLDTGTDGIAFVTADIGTPIATPAKPGPATLILEDGSRATVTIAANGTIPAIDTPGYHRLETDGRAITLAVAPMRCVAPPPGHSWGPAVMLVRFASSRLRLNQPSSLRG